LTLEKFYCDLLSGWGKHNCALEHSNDGTDVLMYLLKKLLDSSHLQVDKLVHRILCRHVLGRYLNLLKDVWLENIDP
jgi:hypothetical protein